MQWQGDGGYIHLGKIAAQPGCRIYCIFARPLYNVDPFCIGSLFGPHFERH